MTDEPYQTPAEVLAHMRTAWVPVTEAAEGPVTASKFGGRPWLAADESWPVCPNCENPMQHFAQLNLDELPERARAEMGSLQGSGLVQLFYCTSVEPHCEIECQAFAPFASSVLARYVPQPLGASNPEATLPEDAFAERIIVGWQEVEDVPSDQEIEEELELYLDDDVVDAMFENDDDPKTGDKLGGWPFWVQNIEYPECPECGERMEYLLQLDAEQNVPYSFGGGGCGHVTRCPNHPEVIGFGWAC